MDFADLEALAVDAYRETRLDDETPQVVRLARTLLGPDAVERGARPIGAPAALVRVGDSWRIILSRSLPTPYALHAIGHELGHWLLMRERYDADDEEAAADYIGAALVAPRRAFASAMHTLGDDLAELAAAFHSTETAAALRLGEVTGRPLAVIAPHRVRVRGPESWAWPDESTLRAWARRGREGVRRVRLRDDDRRVVLEADVA